MPRRNNAVNRCWMCDPGRDENRWVHEFRVQGPRLRVEDGTTRERDVVALKGSKARPLTIEEQQAKLAEAGKGMLTPDELAALADDCRAVAEQGIAPVTRWLRTAAYRQ